METAAERLYRLFLVHPKRSWSQTELSTLAGCSRGYTSRVAAGLAADGVIGRPYRNRVVLLSPSKLLTLWASRRSLPAPLWVDPRIPRPDVLGTLSSTKGAAFTLFHAAWLRTRFAETSSVEAYVPAQRAGTVARRLGTPRDEPTTVALYPTDGSELEGWEWVDGQPVVSVPQNVVDLIALGGQGPRVGFQLARAHGLLGD